MCNDYKNLVTIVTVTFNAADILEKTIRSVISQSYKKIEYIIIDGKSTDSTLDIVNQYISFISYVKSEADNGIYDAMNKGIQLAHGEWILFLNAGDVLSSSTVIENIFSLNDLSSYGVVYGNKQEYHNNKLISIKPKPFFINKGFTKAKGICHQSLFVRTSLAKEVPFDLQYSICADYAMLRTLYYDRNVNFHYIDIDVCVFDLSGYSSKFGKLASYQDFCISNPKIRISLKTYLIFNRIEMLLYKLYKKIRS